MARNLLVAKRCFSDYIIIWCVRWYLRFRLSYRDLAFFVHQPVKDLKGDVLLGQIVLHVFGIENGPIKGMDIQESKAAPHNFVPSRRYLGRHPEQLVVYAIPLCMGF